MTNTSPLGLLVTPALKALAAVVGKSVENVVPAINALPFASTAIPKLCEPWPPSSKEPPRYVE